MKDYMINKSIEFIKKYYNYSDEKTEEIKYGLSGLYTTLTKIIVIFLIAYIIGIMKEELLFFAFLTPLRTFGFGFHSNSNRSCWIVSLTIFLLFPILAKIIVIQKAFLITNIIITGILLIIFSPADTEKRPLVNPKKRMRCKILMGLTVFIYLIVFLLSNNNILINVISLACTWQLVCVCPISYVLSHQKYNNYKSYKFV